MNKKVVALLIVILIVVVIAGIIFAINNRENNRTNNFCSHGGGGFGQSITDISKLAPNSRIGEGLSIHYSGGSSLENDISNWLNANGISEN